PAKRLVAPSKTAAKASGRMLLRMLSLLPCGLPRGLQRSAMETQLSVFADGGDHPHPQILWQPDRRYAAGRRDHRLCGGILCLFQLGSEYYFYFRGRLGENEGRGQQNQG